MEKDTSSGRTNPTDAQAKAAFMGPALGVNRCIATFGPTGLRIAFLEEDPDLSTLTPEKYQSMMPAIERNFKIAMEMGTSEDYMWEHYLKKLF